MRVIYNKPRCVFDELSDFITKIISDENLESIKAVEITPEMKKLLVEEIKLTWEEQDSEGEMQLHKWEHDTYDTYGNGGYNYLVWDGVFELNKPYKVNKYGETIRSINIVVEENC